MSICSSPSHGYFTEAYRDYERQNPRSKLDHYVDHVIAATPPKAGSLLDVGCGLGSFLERVSIRRPDLVLSATDLHPEAVSATAARVPAATVKEASAEHLPFPAGSMDVITAWDVIEHVPDLARVRSEVLRALRPGGVFIFVVPVYDGVTGPLVSRLDKDPTHLHKYSRDHWLQWAGANFRLSGWHGVFRYLMGPVYLHWPTGTLRRASPAILVSCVKSD